MSVQEMSLPTAQNSLIPDRFLGIVGMVFSPMLFFASFFFSPQYDAPNTNPILAGLGGVLYLLGAMASATAMRNLRVTGSGKGAKILYVVQMTGLFLAMCFDVLDNAAPNLRGTLIHTITDIAYPFSHLLMIIVGIAVIRAKVWRGWKRIPALLIGLGLPVFIISSAIFGREAVSFTFPLFTTAGFFLLGLAVFRSIEKNR